MPDTGLKIPSNFLDYLASSAFTKAAVYQKVMEGTIAERGAIKPAGQLSRGLICAPKANIPEYHDGASDYFQDAFATADGWASMGADTVVSVASGELVFTAGASPTTFVRANKAQAASSRSVRIKWRCTQADLTTLEYRTSGGGTTVSKSIAGRTSGIEDIMCGASFTDLEIRFNSTGNMSASTPVQIDFIQVYNPAIPYSSLALDASGNGNHGTVFGCTPVAGITGRALSFDGVNDIVRFDINKHTFTGAFTIHAYIQGKASRAGAQGIYGRGGGLAGKRGIRVQITTANVVSFFVSGDGTASTTLVADAGSEITADCSIDCVFVPSTRMSIYKNGVLIKETTTGVPSAAFWESTMVPVMSDMFNTLANTYDGWIDDPRIYNRALSAEEIWELYQNPGGNCINDMEVSVTPTMNSIVARGPDGRIRLSTHTPATAGAAGTVGQIAYDASYIYICTATNTWKRVAIASW